MRARHNRVHSLTFCLENAIVDGDGTSVVTTKEDASTIFERDPNPANQVSAMVTGVLLDENGKNIYQK